MSQRSGTQRRVTGEWDTETNLSDRDLPELARQCEDTEELDLTESWFQQLVISRYRLVGAVVVTGNTSQFCHLYKPLRLVNLSHDNGEALSGRLQTMKLPLRLSYLTRLCLSRDVAAVWMRSLRRCSSHLSVSISSRLTPYSVGLRNILMNRYV